MWCCVAEALGDRSPWERGATLFLPHSSGAPLLVGAWPLRVFADSNTFSAEKFNLALVNTEDDLSLNTSWSQPLRLVWSDGDGGRVTCLIEDRHLPPFRQRNDHSPLIKPSTLN